MQSALAVRSVPSPDEPPPAHARLALPASEALDSTSSAECMAILSVMHLLTGAVLTLPATSPADAVRRAARMEAEQRTRGRPSATLAPLPPVVPIHGGVCCGHWAAFDTGAPPSTTDPATLRTLPLAL